MIPRIKPTVSKPESAPLPTFKPTVAFEGDTIPDGAVAVVIPAAVWAAFASGPLVRSKDGTGSTARPCNLEDLPPLLLPREDGSEITVKLNVGAWVPLDKTGAPKR